MPQPFVLPGKPVLSIGKGVSYAATGAVLTYTAAAGKPAICTSAMSDGQAVTTQTDLETVNSGNAIKWNVGAANTVWRLTNTSICINAGDSVRINVITTTVADVGDVALSIVEAP